MVGKKGVLVGGKNRYHKSDRQNEEGELQKKRQALRYRK